MNWRNLHSRPLPVWKTVSLSMALTPVLAIHAQDALRSAVLGDEAYSLRSAPIPAADLPNYHHVGPVQYTIGLSYAAEYVDNVFYAPRNEHTDVIHTTQVDFGFRWKASSSAQLTFGGGIGYRAFTHYSSQDRLAVTPNSELAYDIPIKDFMLTLYDRFSYTEDVLSQSALSGSSLLGNASLPRFDNTVGWRLGWRPNRWVSQIGYGHQNYFSSASTFTYLDHVTEHFFGRVGYLFHPSTEGGIEVTGSLTDYQAVTQSDNQSVSAGPYLHWQAMRSLSLDLRGGYVEYFFDPSQPPQARSSLKSYYAGLDVKHDLTRYISHTLSLKKEIQQGLNQGGQYINLFGVRYSLHYNFYKHAGLFGDVFYDDGKEPRLTVQETYKLTGFGGGLEYQISQRFSARVRFTHAQRTSSAQDRGYHVNDVVLGVHYTF